MRTQERAAALARSLALSRCNERAHGKGFALLCQGASGEIRARAIEHT